MNIIKEDIDALHALIKIQLDPSDYLDPVEKSLRELRKKIEVKGFRKGYTPVSLLKKLYGNAILAEELNKMVSSQLNAFLKDHQIDILGNPIPKDDVLPHINIYEPKHYEFAFELGLMPEFNLPALDQELPLTRYKIIVDDTLLDKEINALRRRYGTLADAAGHIHPDDVLHVELHELQADMGLKPEGYSCTTAFPFYLVTDVFLQEALRKLQPGDTVDIDIFKAMVGKSREEIIRNILGINNDDVADKVGALYRLTLRKVSHLQPAEMNEDFYYQILGDSTIKTEEEFRNALKVQISKSLDERAKKLFYRHVVEFILDHTSIDLPDAFLKKWLKTNADSPLTETQVNQEYPVFSRKLKWQLIAKKLVQENNIRVTAEEISDDTRRQVRNFFNISEEQWQEDLYQKWIHELMHDEAHVKKTAEKLLDDKLAALFLQKINAQEKEVSLDEFNQIIQQ